MNWLTKRQIANAVAVGSIASIYCSMIHWQQILEAGPKEYCEASDVSIGCDNCALCQRQLASGKTLKCPLNGKCCERGVGGIHVMNCCEEYYTAREAIYLELKHPMYQWHPKTQIIITKLIERIRDVLPKM